MTDPLSLLRQYNVNKKEIIERDGQIIFDEISWPKNIKTNYVMWSSGKNGIPKEYYTLECLLYLLKNVSLIHPAYLRQAGAENIPVIKRPDRQLLLSYLNGQTTSCPSIDTSAPLEIPTQDENSTDYDGPESESLAKKPQFEDTHVQCMSALPDPLSLLRQYNINKKEIIERDGQIIFGEFSWPKNVKTNYLMWGSGTVGTPKEYYTLECLLYLLKTVSLNYPGYLIQAGVENIPVVRKPDRRWLLSYLNGQTTSCASIDTSAPLENPTQVKSSTDYNGPKSLPKKPRFENTDVQWMSALMDPVSLLRQYNINKKEIIERDGQIIFGEFSWPKNVKTNVIWNSGEKGAPKKYYTLECLLFLLKTASLVNRAFVRQSAAENIPTMKPSHRQWLLAYLNGETTNCPFIDTSAPVEIPTQVKRSADYDGPKSLAKKQTKKSRFEDIHVQCMSAEQIAAIKAKHLAPKKTTIKVNDDICQEYDIRPILDLYVDITEDFSGITYISGSS